MKTNKNDKTATRKEYNKSNLVYSSRYCFYKYYDIEKFDKLSFKSKYSYLLKFYYDLDKLSKKSQKENTKEKKTNVFDTASELYELLWILYQLRNTMI